MADALKTDVHDAFQQLYDALDDAYWAATTIETKDRIRGVAEAILDAITELNRKEFDERSAKFQELGQTMSKVNAKLSQLKDDIDNLIHNIKTAATVASYIDRAIELAVKYFKI